MYKNWLIVIFNETFDQPILNSISKETVFEDFELAYDALAKWILHNEDKEIEPPKKSGAVNYTIGKNHYQIWETNFPPNNFNDERN